MFNRLRAWWRRRPATAGAGTPTTPKETAVPLGVIHTDGTVRVVRPDDPTDRPMTYEEASSITMVRTFTTGHPHIARQRPDGSWEVKRIRP
jgi:hypothetical protein